MTDPATAQPVFESGQADIWQAADAQARADLVGKGYTVQTGWAGFEYHLMPNTVDPASPMAKKEVREALEYALDKEAICKAHRLWRLLPHLAVSPEGEWGSDALKVKRKYNPEKAKELLTAAGYADGCPIDLLAVVEAGGSNTAAEAIKGYLDAAGFVTNIDIGDPGRFYGSVFGAGWKDVALMFSGNDYNYLMSCNAWWGRTQDQPGQLPASRGLQGPLRAGQYGSHRGRAEGQDRRYRLLHEPGGVDGAGLPVARVGQPASMPARRAPSS